MVLLYNYLFSNIVFNVLVSLIPSIFLSISFLSFHSSRGHYKTCEYILDVLADQYIRYSCDEDGGKSLSYSLERDGLDPYIGAFKDVVDLKSMNYVKEDDEYVWGYR